MPSQSIAVFSVLALLAAASAFAAGAPPDVELTVSFGGGPIGGLAATGGPSGSVSILTGGPDTITTVGIAGGIGFIVNQNLEIMTNPALEIVSRATTSTLFSIEAGPMLNFMAPIEDSPFFYVGPGIVVLSGTNTVTNFEFTVAFGKRFRLFDRISYSPEFSYTGITSSPYLSSIGITPIQFSLFL